MRWITRSSRSQSPSRPRTSSAFPQRRLGIESLEYRRLLHADPLNPAAADLGDNALAQVHGQKWNDTNANGLRDPNENGLAGVTVYSDLNNNGQLDKQEPRTITMRDDPTTRFDETGRYWLEGLQPGRHVIREVVPEGFVQTFPLGTVPTGEDGEPGDGFSSVAPDRIQVSLAAGEVLQTQVSWTFDPLCIRPFEVDVDATDPDVSFENLTGVVTNGCGGDVSTFEVRLVGDGLSHAFDLQFVDAEFGGILDVIPVTILAPGQSQGAHIVGLEPADTVEGIDFGNRRVPETGSIHGRKWHDQDGDGSQDPNEAGLPGVTIYADRNNNGQLDNGEPRTVTMRDDPTTRFDETGRYWLEGLQPGRHVIREVVPEGFVQTFPLGIVPTGEDGEPGDGFSSVAPDRIQVSLAAGEALQTQVSWTFDPLCIRPFEVDVDATDPDVSFENLTGVVTNGCGGDVSTFEVRLVGDGLSHAFDLQFVDAEFGGILDVIPVTILAPGKSQGAHIVGLEPADTVEGIDFGNRRVESGDFNDDGLLSCHDLSSLNEAIVAASEGAITAPDRIRFDVNGDAMVNFADTQHWITNIYGTLIGDANLDYRVNATDLNILGLNWQRSDDLVSWCNADFNGDHVVDARDLNDIGLKWQAAAFFANTERTPQAALDSRVSIRDAQLKIVQPALFGGIEPEQFTRLEDRHPRRTRRFDEYFSRRNSQQREPHTVADRFERLADDVFAQIALTR